MPSGSVNFALDRKVEKGRKDRKRGCKRLLLDFVMKIFDDFRLMERRMSVPILGTDRKVEKGRKDRKRAWTPLLL